MEKKVLTLSDGEPAVLMNVRKASRSAENQYMQKSRTKTKLTFHVPQGTVRVSPETHCFGDCNNLSEEPPQLVD